MTELTVISPPAEEPVSLAAAKAFLRVGHDGEDALISDLIASGRARIEQESGIALVQQTLRVTWTRWSSTLAGRGVRLPRRPVRALVAVHIMEADETLTDQTERFRLDCGRLMLRPWSQCPPLTPGAKAHISFEAGYGTAEEVPDDLKEACLRLTSALYANRSGALAALPDTVQTILSARREVRL